MGSLIPNAVPAVDVVLLSFEGGVVRVALAPGMTDAAHGALALPGVLLRAKEDVPSALSRMTSDKLLGIYGGPYRPFGFSADPNRDPRGRVVSLFHAGFLGPAEVAALEAGTSYRMRCLSIRGSTILVDGTTERLAYDHHEILLAAARWLRQELPRGGITRDLLGDLFTRAALREVYEAVFGFPIQKQSFDYHLRQKVLAEPTGLIAESSPGRGRPAELYRPPSNPPLYWEPTK